jgi:hypothetical protein
MLFPVALWAADQPKPPLADTDIGDIAVTPLDSTSAALRNQAQPADQALAVKPAAIPAETVKAPQVPTPAGARPKLPPLPADTQAAVTQIGGLTLHFEMTPLDDVVRIVSRQLDRPLHYAVPRQIRVSGDWSDCPAGTVLKEIAAKYGLHFEETPEAYVLDDNGRPMPLQVATVPARPPDSEGRGVVDLLLADALVRPVPPLTGQAAAKALAALAREEERAGSARQKLLEQLRN